MAAPDYKALAEVVENMREIVNAFVAGLVADGFSDEQARDIVAGIYRMAGKEGDDDSPTEQS